ncbi:MAG: endonuclease MutS2, partial [Clostridia bacterium]|nr:endonuclease MutS2 [Clostridia bacterium]
MNTKVFVKLEFDKILKMLANKALSDSGKREAVSLKPSKSISAVTRLQSETLEAESTLMRSAKTPMSGFSDISSETSRLKAGADLSCRELLRILGVLKSARRAKRGLVKVEGSTNLLPHMAEQLYYDDGMITELDDAIMSDSELADTASHELFNIRKRIMRENEGIREKLNAVIRSSHHKEHLQDAIVTMRSGRYVVPVKQEFKRNIKGLVHDQSASGQTVFIEPMEVVEANNKLRELELAEREEVERILHVFSERLREFWSELKNNLNILTRLDVIFAKAALASTMKASPVTITDEKKIIIKNGRHPLIDAKEVVPVSLHIDEGYSGLIITGPNTGGKTVTLKLTGLLAL